MTTPTETGLAVIELAEAGDFAKIREMFAPQLRALVSADVLRSGWAAQGALSSVGTPVADGPAVVRIPVTFEQGATTVVLSVDDAGLLTGVQVVPAEPAALWTPPDYADEAAFDEQDVMLGSGPLAVPGTVTVPRRPGSLPAVVLLAGSGPNDRDETVGRNKPFKDLAWGLASRGIVVLRFDKVTFTHGRELTDPAFTLADEYLPDAKAAVRVLAEHPAVDAARIFVLGHSLGGTVAPRVAAAEPAVAGLVIMAGGTQPSQWAMVRQVRYIASLNADTEAAAQPAIDAMTKQAQALDSPDLVADTPATDLPFGVPAPYWLDLRDYHQVEVAATLDIPILVVQGGRDYQVTIADDLVHWQAGLAARPHVTFRVHDADDHLFLPGTGPSTPTDYETAQHVDPEVIDDLTAWLTADRPWLDARTPPSPRR